MKKGKRKKGDRMHLVALLTTMVIAIVDAIITAIIVVLVAAICWRKRGRREGERVPLLSSSLEGGGEDELPPLSQAP